MFEPGGHRSFDPFQAAEHVQADIEAAHAMRFSHLAAVLSMVGALALAHLTGSDDVIPFVLVAGYLVAFSLLPEERMPLGWLGFFVVFVGVVACATTFVLHGRHLAAVGILALGLGIRFLGRRAVRGTDAFDNLPLLIRYEVTAHWVVPWVLCAEVLIPLWSIDSDSLPLAAKSALSATLGLAALAAGLKTAARARKTCTALVELIDGFHHDLGALRLAEGRLHGNRAAQDTARGSGEHPPERKDVDERVLAASERIRQLDLALRCPPATPYKHVGASLLTAQAREALIAELRRAVRAEHPGSAERTGSRRAALHKLARLRDSCVRWYDVAG
ncbi:hypothetical protein MUU72_08755 [Streptomyces sp. RS10V-4]|uniref:hypothetical protein n=1 Tax=Streptomyces rhizoryzae TaxID=2932493 RepID=UPI002002C681|nr:hypothetical protein [Streptomyces rhizoryzae]MCK7623186.1 hypothetical protein [Streptomyces rhizoryzae]